MVNTRTHPDPALCVIYLNIGRMSAHNYRAQLQAQLGTAPLHVTQALGPVAGNAPSGVPLPFPTPVQFQSQQFAVTHPGAPAPSHVAQASAQSLAGQGRERGRGCNRRGPDTPRTRGQPGEAPRTKVAHPPASIPWRTAHPPLNKLEAIYKALTMTNSRMSLTPKGTIIRETSSDW